MTRDVKLTAEEGINAFENGIVQLDYHERRRSALAELTTLNQTTVDHILAGEKVWYDKLKLFHTKINALLQARQVDKPGITLIPELVPDVHFTFVTQSRSVPPVPVVPEAELAQQYANLLVAASGEGIVAIYHREMNEFRTIVEQVVRDADEFVYILGRTHKHMLVEGTQAGWLIPTLQHTLTHSPRVRIRLLIGDGFHPESGFMRQVANSGQAVDGRKGAARDTAREILRLIDDACGENHEFRHRIMHEAPPHSLLMTDKRALIEHYLPSHVGGACIILEVKPTSLPQYRKRLLHMESMYDAILWDFVTLYNDSQKPLDVFKQHIDDKEDQGAALDANDRRRLEDLRGLLPIAERWGSTDLDLKVKPKR